MQNRSAPQFARLALASIAGLATAMLGACSSSTTLQGESHSAILLNPTPAETTPSMSRYEVDNRIYGITFDQNLQQVHDDWIRFWLLERPSRLTPYPVAY